MRPAETAEPIDDDALDALFAPFEEASRIALAISGGADSLALLLLIDRWRKRGRRPEPIVLTVDHALRPGSAKEARRVATLARERGMRARILTWKGDRPASDVEAAARAARYRLLVEAARSARASHLLLAHHRDDVAETFLMRLQRGSGVHGLAGMRPHIPTAGMVIARPLLDVPRAVLAATVADAGLAPVDDSMNRDPRYLRARIRRLMPLLAEEGIDPAELAATGRRLADAADALDLLASRLMALAVATDDLAVAWLDPTRFFAVPGEVRNRAFARLILAIGGDLHTPRFERLTALADAMDRHRAGRFKRTLGGTVVEWRRGAFALYREIGREGLPTLSVKSGFAGSWDHRFHVEIGRGAPGGLELGPLGEEGRIKLGIGAAIAPAGAVAALPALHIRRAVVAVPSVSYWAKGRTRFPVKVRTLLADRLLEPPRFPDFTDGN